MVELEKFDSNESADDAMIGEQDEELIKTEETSYKELMSKEIESMCQIASPEVDKYFHNLYGYLDALLNSNTVSGLIVSGDAGLGKSFSTIKRLKELNKEFEKDWVILNTHSSPLELYNYLYTNTDKIIILDDVSNLFEDESKINILMAALWSPTNCRVVTWNSSTDKLRAPSQFEFKGKIIVLTNRVPERLDTLKSRCFYYELEFSFDDKIRLLHEISKLHNVEQDVVDFIRTHATPAHPINFRTLFKINEIYKTHKTNGWQTLASLEIKADPVRLILWKILQDDNYRTTAEKIRRFVEESGLSRRSYFRYKAELQCQNAISIEMTH